MQPPSATWSQELVALAGDDAQTARAAAQLCNEWDLAGDRPSGLAAIVLDDVQLGLTLRDQWEKPSSVAGPRERLLERPVALTQPVPELLRLFLGVLEVGEHPESLFPVESTSTGDSMAMERRSC